MNYFEFYGIPVSFQVDESALKQIFYENSKKYHPDFHTQSEVEWQEEMLEKSSLNNEAYKTLLDPDRRIRYVLEINGLLGDESVQAPLPQAFLMDMMDINEALMELEFDFDAVRYEQAVEAVKSLEQSLDNDIRPALESYSATGDTAADLTAVRDYYLKKRYLLRIQENLSKFAGPAGMAEW